MVGAAAAVALWMGLGFILRLSSNAYLLLGVPITLAFQLLIRRRPLREMWVRDAGAFRLDRTGTVIAVALAVTPAYALARDVATERMDWVETGWLLCAIAGAVAAAFAFRAFTRETVRHLVGCLATAGLLGMGLFVAAWLARDSREPLTQRAPIEGLRWFLLYLPAACVLEEVFFRGVLDAHVHRRGQSHGLATAIFVSLLWGLWHLPVSPANPLWLRAVGLAAVHVIVGVPLSIYWRRSGNLAVPATVHALSNGVRNALMLPV